MSSITPEAEAAAWSFWTTDYWLRHCEEYRVWDASGPLGYVEAVLTTEDDEPHSLVVRVGSVSGELVTWPVEAVESLDAATEFVARLDEHREREEQRQFLMPLPPGLRD